MSSTVSSAVAAATGAHPQGGIIEGLNPIHYNPKDPIALFIIQAFIIIIFCRLLHYPLSKLGEPRVIAEVIGGIILGPSVMMRIPGFQENIFPTESMPVLTNVANLGLLLFLFLVGLEVDTRMFKSNWRVALSVGLASMIIPFGLGVAVAWGLYKEFGSEGNMENMEFGTFALFIGTALAITAFPVLCRILSELQLLGTAVGVTVLAAGIGNDVTGWVLLALSVALVNNASGLTALYVFLTAVAWVLFLVYAIRPVFLWILRRTDSIQNGPSQGITALTLLLVLVSAWFTAAIGVHAIFGAFLIGVICPHDGGFAIKLTEKIEDLVASLLLPLYFALSGLNTDLGLLNDGKTWGYVIAVIACAFFGKIIGGTVAARFCQCLWRESFTIGVLMSCKGLVELIVLNIGLQAGLLSRRTFTMFVVMALVTTVATAPLTRWLYPVWYRQKVEKWRRGEIEWDGSPIVSEAQASEHRMEEALDKSQTRRLILHLRLDALSGLFNLVALLGDARKATNSAITEKGEEGTSAGHASDSGEEKSRPPIARPLEVHGLRLMELTDRTSSVMQSAEADEFTSRDAVFSAFQTFSRLNGVAVAGQVSIIPTSAYAETLIKCAEEVKSDFMLIPWSTYGGLSEENSAAAWSDAGNPNDRFFSRTYVDYVQGALAKSTCTTGIYISRNPDDRALSKRPSLKRSAHTGLSVHSTNESNLLRSPIDQNQRICVPFIGGKDDRAALLFVLQLAHNPHVSITVVHLTFSEEDPEIETHLTPESDPSASNGLGKAVVGIPSATDMDLLNTAKKNASKALEGRVTFIEVPVESIRSLPDRAVAQAREVVGKSRLNVGDLVVVGRSHPFFDNLLVDDFGVEREFQRTVGVLGDRFARAGIDAGVLVIDDKHPEA